MVVVPNLLDPDNAAVGAWLRERQQRGAVLASICEGARVLAHNGLLDGHAATTHFAAIEDLRSSHPRVRWQRDMRYVDDGAVVSSAGVTAGIDAALHLVERFAGADIAARTAAALALPPPTDPAVTAPRLTPALLSAGLLNGAFSWPKTGVALQLADGVDELSVAAVLDAYPRTFAAVARSVSRRARTRGFATRLTAGTGGDARRGARRPLHPARHRGRSLLRLRPRPRRHRDALRRRHRRPRRRATRVRRRSPPT